MLVNLAEHCTAWMTSTLSVGKLGNVSYSFSTGLANRLCIRARRAPMDLMRFGGSKYDLLWVWCIRPPATPLGTAMSNVRVFGLHCVVDTWRGRRDRVYGDGFIILVYGHTSITGSLVQSFCKCNQMTGNHIDHSRRNIICWLQWHFFETDTNNLVVYLFNTVLLFDFNGLLMQAKAFMATIWQCQCSPSINTYGKRERCLWYKKDQKYSMAVSWVGFWEQKKRLCAHGQK